MFCHLSGKSLSWNTLSAVLPLRTRKLHRLPFFSHSCASSSLKCAALKVLWEKVISRRSKELKSDPGSCPLVWTPCRKFGWRHHVSSSGWGPDCSVFEPVICSSDHKTGRTFCVSQERGIVERMVWSKWSLPLVWSRVGVGGGGVGVWWVRLGREAKNASKKYDRNCQRQNKRKKTKETKWQFHSLKAVEKLVQPNSFLLINNKAPKVLDAQVQYIPKNEGMHVFNL